MIVTGGKEGVLIGYIYSPHMCTAAGHYYDRMSLLIHDSTIIQAHMSTRYPITGVWSGSWTSGTGGGVYAVGVNSDW